MIDTLSLSRHTHMQSRTLFSHLQAVAALGLKPNKGLASWGNRRSSPTSRDNAGEICASGSSRRILSFTKLVPTCPVLRARYGR
jgi:hypothetical protein